MSVLSHEDAKRVDWWRAERELGVRREAPYPVSSCVLRPGTGPSPEVHAGAQ